jgi:D-lactate dehydrogenase (cytochrome)
VAPTLFFELHGTPAGIAEQTGLLQEIAAESGGEAFRAASDPTERNRLWQARHDAHYAGLALRPGARVLGTDVCVPISRLAECIVETKADIARASFPITLLGHVGDGNFHLGLLIDPDDPRELAEAQAINDRLVMRALAMDGTCTGEHGIGLGKRRYLEAEHGEAVTVMAAIKQLLDPKDIMNPGKVLP